MIKIKYHFLKYLYFIVFFLFNTVIFCQLSPQQIIKKMDRGINLGNTLNAPIEGNWAPAVQESYFYDISQAGFKTVRIPIRFDKHTTQTSDVIYKDSIGNYIGCINDYSVDSVFLNRLEQVINWALKYKLFAILDVHGDHWFWESYKPGSEYFKTGADRFAVEDRFKAIWTAISSRLYNYSDSLLFEIMNEPYFSMNSEQVHNINNKILKIIRKTNPKRFVIITGGGQNSWEAPFTIKKDLIQSDSFLIATFHYYLPRKFTVSSKEGFDDYEWGSNEEKAVVDFHFDSVKSWAEDNNICVLLGEFGADNENGYNYYYKKYKGFGGPTRESREEYHRYLANAAISRGFAFTVWDAGEKSNKSIYLASTRSWVEGVKNAVLGINTSSQETETTEIANMFIYPNPCFDNLMIETYVQIENIEILDIFKNRKIVDFDGEYSIDVSGFSSGLYYLVVFLRNGKRIFLKFIKI